ncbi:hypothetical protein [Kribbella deserti]|uniref:Uncharacterized protein n=1 Tax=Kribbella deserti TaxID=1926257 RepID=A0ABV6QX34_9ACTN
MTKRLPNGNGTLSLGWSVSTVPDHTPNDPLDVEALVVATRT